MTETDAADLGRMRFLALMVMIPDFWIKRRVETITYGDNGETRRAVSIDFQLPERYRKTASQDGPLLVPVALLEKKPLTRFDMRGADGTAIPVLDTDANSELATRCVTDAISVLLALDESVVEDVKDLIETVVRSPEPVATPAAEQLTNALRERLTGVTPAQELVLQLVSDLAKSFLLVAECDSRTIRGRSILKFSYEEPIEIKRRWLPLTRSVQIARPAVSAGKSYHLEIRAPQGLAVTDLVVTELGEQPRTWTASHAGPTAHGHLTLRGSGDFEARAAIRPERRGPVTYALLSSIVVLALTIAAVFWPQQVFQLDREPETAIGLATVTLAIPAFLLALLARTPEHVLVSVVLRPTRAVLLLTSTVLLAISGIIILRPAEQAAHSCAIALACLEAFLTVYVALIAKKSAAGPSIVKTSPDSKPLERKDGQ